MSDKFSVMAFFGDADHTFSLHDNKGDGWDLLRELERRCDMGCMAIFKALYNGTQTLDMIRDTLRLGLIGGGKPASEAAHLVKFYVDREPIGEHAGLALEVMGAAIFGKGAAPT